MSPIFKPGLMFLGFILLLAMPLIGIAQIVTVPVDAPTTNTASPTSPLTPLIIQTTANDAPIDPNIPTLPSNSNTTATNSAANEPTPIPVLDNVALLILILALLALGLREIRRNPAILSSVLIVSLAGLMFWHSPKISAKLTIGLNNPGGEVSDIPIQPIIDAESIINFEPAVFTNQTQTALRIESISLPDYKTCFPKPLNLPMAESSIDDEISTSCKAGMELAPGSSCHIDVRSACQTQAIAAQAQLSVTPSSVELNTAGEKAKITISNKAESPVAAQTVSLDVGSDFSVTGSCPESLAPGESCELTITALIEGATANMSAQGTNTFKAKLAAGPTPIAMVGRVLNEQGLVVLVEPANSSSGSSSGTGPAVSDISLDLDKLAIEAFDGSAVHFIVNQGSKPLTGVAISHDPKLNIESNCKSEIAAASECELLVIAKEEGGPYPINISAANGFKEQIPVSVTKFDPNPQFTAAQGQALQDDLTCDLFYSVPFPQGLKYFLPEPIREALNSPASVSFEKGYEVRRCGKASLLIKSEGSIPVHTILLIEGEVDPTNYGIWSKLDSGGADDTRVIDPLLYSVALGSEIKNQEATDFPSVLSDAINRSYRGKLSLKAGSHVTGQLKVRGILGDVLAGMNYPTDDLLFSYGREVAPSPYASRSNVTLPTQSGSETVSSPVAIPGSPVTYIELAHFGDWNDSAGIEGLTLTDTTVYYDEDNNFGFWGVGNFESNPVALFYKGPLKVSKNPKSYKEAQIGFAAQEMNMGAYMRFIAAYESRYPRLSGDLFGISDTVDNFYTTVMAPLKALPLDIVSIRNDKLANFYQSFKSGDDFPALDNFNLAILGPLAESLDGIKGPYARVQGVGELFNTQMGSIDFSATPGGASGSMKGDPKLNLGSVAGISLGSLGSSATLDFSADSSGGAMSLTAAFLGGSFPGSKIKLNFSSDAITYAIPGSCAKPLSIAARTSLPQPYASIQNGDINFSPTASLPNPADLLSCGEDIYFLVRNGVVYAFNGTVQLLEFGNSFLPENEVTRLGIDGIKFAGNAIVDAPAEILNIGKSIPGVSQGIDAAEQAAAEAAALAAKAAAEAAAKAKQAAEKAAQEAANAAAAAIRNTANFVNNVVRDPAGVANNVIRIFSGALSSVFGNGKSLDGFGWIWQGNPAVDISNGHTDVENVWLVREDGTPLKVRRGVYNRVEYMQVRSGLPHNAKVVRIDADNGGGALAILSTGEIYTTNAGLYWRKANGYATDIGVGGGYVWMTSTEPQWGSYRIYRARFYGSGQTYFNWEYMHGAGTRIDVGGDGKAWTINYAYTIWEWDGWWQARNFSGMDLAVSQSNRAWVASLNYVYGNGGGRIYTYNTPGTIGVPVWEEVQGSAHAVGAGFGRTVWVTNSFNNIYSGTGRL